MDLNEDSIDGSLSRPLLEEEDIDIEDDGNDDDNITSDNCTDGSYWTTSNLRKVALDLSLWINIIILLTKVIAYIQTLSLSVLAALVDSILDVVSQWILLYTEQTSSKH